MLTARMATPSPRPAAEVVDLVSDDEEPELQDADAFRTGAEVIMDPVDFTADYEAFQPQNRLPATGLPACNGESERLHHNGRIMYLGGEEIFVPEENSVDLDDLMRAHFEQQQDGHEDKAAPLSTRVAEPVTLDDCLRRVSEIFPDISHEHVHTLWNSFGHEDDYETLPGVARLDSIVEQLVSVTSYPKEDRNGQARKRKRVDTTAEPRTQLWDLPNRDPIPHYFRGSMRAILKSEFPLHTVTLINSTLATEKHLFPAYVALGKAKLDSDSLVYGRGRSSRGNAADAMTIANNSGWPDLPRELAAARQRVEQMTSEHAVKEAKKQIEQDNLNRAIAAGEIAECSACFDGLPMNRQLHCNGPTAHFTCFECAATYVKSEVGESRCGVLCPAGCGAGFAHHQLDLLEDKQLLAKLAQLQQEKDIRDAGLDDLEECPFCDYKAILPPVDEDFEFRCANPECEKVSCRRCKASSHIPISCEQYAKDNKVSSRHKIEEAMTAALIRSCNKCNKTFIKDYGCNKMTCPSCGHRQCYVCSASIKDYEHFAGDGRRRAIASGGSAGCPLYDNVEERHEREVQEAEKAARAEVVAENPDISVEDLEIKVSGVVKHAAKDRIRRAGGPAEGVIAYAQPVQDMGFEMGRHGHDPADWQLEVAALMGLDYHRLGAARGEGLQDPFAAHIVHDREQAQGGPLPINNQALQHLGQPQGFTQGYGLNPAVQAAPRIRPPWQRRGQDLLNGLNGMYPPNNLNLEDLLNAPHLPDFPDLQIPVQIEPPLYNPPAHQLTHMVLPPHQSPYPNPVQELPALAEAQQRQQPPQRRERPYSRVADPRIPRAMPDRQGAQNLARLQMMRQRHDMQMQARATLRQQQAAAAATAMQRAPQLPEQSPG